MSKNNDKKKQRKEKLQRKFFYRIFETPMQRFLRQLVRTDFCGSGRSMPQKDINKPAPLKTRTPNVTFSGVKSGVISIIH